MTQKTRESNPQTSKCKSTAFFMMLALWLYAATFKFQALTLLKNRILNDSIPILTNMQIGFLTIAVITLIPIAMAWATFPQQKGYAMKAFCGACLCNGFIQCAIWSNALLAWNCHLQIASPEIPIWIKGLSMAIGQIFIAAWAYSELCIAIFSLMLCKNEWTKYTLENLREITLSYRCSKDKASYIKAASLAIKEKTAITEAMLLTMNCLPYRIYEFFHSEDDIKRELD